MIFSYFDGLTAGEAILLLLAYVIAIVVAIVLHEFSHSYIAVKMGDNTPKAYGRLTLNTLAHFDAIGLICFVLVGFGWAKPVPINTLNFRNHKKGVVAVSLAGITTNIIIAFISAGLVVCVSNLMPESTFKFFLSYLFGFGMIINLSLAVFNLLPIYPLDGFNFLNAFMRYDNKFVDFNMRYGQILLLILLISGLVGWVLGYAVNGIVWVFEWFWNLIF